MAPSAAWVQWKAWLAWGEAEAEPTGRPCGCGVGQGEPGGRKKRMTSKQRSKCKENSSRICLIVKGRRNVGYRGAKGA